MVLEPVTGKCISKSKFFDIETDENAPKGPNPPTNLVNYFLLRTQRQRLYSTHASPLSRNPTQLQGCVFHFLFRKGFPERRDLWKPRNEFRENNPEKSVVCIQFGCFQFNAEQTSEEKDVNVIFLPMDRVAS